MHNRGPKLKTQGNRAGLLHGLAAVEIDSALELFVILVLAQTCPHALQLGDVVRNLLDGIHLLLEEFRLDEITHLENVKEHK